MPFTATSDARVHYLLDGTGGPAVALVHGVGGDAEKVFGNVVGHFAATRTVIRPNLSGSGETTDSGGQLSIEELADQVAAAIEDGADGPVDLLGFSLGAVVSAVVAATRPELVRRLILLAGWTDSSTPRNKYYFDTWRRLLDLDREALKRFSALTGFSPTTLDLFGHEGLAASLADEWPPPSISRQIDAGAQVDILDHLPNITAPTMVVGLGRDNMIPVEGSHRLTEAIQGSQYIELPDDGHMDWFVDPSAVIKIADEFFSAT
ncbi:alpha/beta fold hydrolase [Glycomyces buryatensis]|uniref:Alpha/beta hydrolase n=1 Tax=Glycomyces buryatensis TaxID=2570927 RepID=A0A4S8PZJ2_9ACTN|nr:alpha/beta hydrolase [Glycomyces buryatensis]THV37090.1 alpha/beta hydrolase [Glycomyces buryatensis]